MRKLLSYGTVAFFTAVMLTACGGGSDSVPTLEYWVAPDGNDSAAGSEAAPFQTFDGARQAVRKLNRTYGGDIVVNIEAGTYRLGQTVSFDANDSGFNGHTVTYRAAEGATVSLFGSVAVDPAKWSNICPETNVSGVYCAYVGDLDPRVLASRQLYVDGRRAVRARTHEYPGGFLPYYDYNGSDKMGILFVPVIDANGSLDSQWPDPNMWQHVGDIEAVALPQWRMLRVPLERVVHYPDYNLSAELKIAEAVLYDQLYLALEGASSLDRLIDLLFDVNQSGMIRLQEPGWTNANLSYTTSTENNVTTYQPAVWGLSRVAWFENALAFLDEPGEWYLDRHAKMLYYLPDANVSLATAQVELPRIDALLEVNGSSHLRFENLTFAYAGWTAPSSPVGYVTDQSGYLITDTTYEYNQIGHVQHVEGTPGNVRLAYVNDVRFSGNIFEHMGAVALSFGTGTQRCVVQNNLFEDIASAAVNLGGVGKADYDPDEMQLTAYNTIQNNLIRYTGVEYYDAAGIFVGFSTHTLIDRNTIAYTNWAGIAMGWGWGLLDPYVNLGVDGATPGMWGEHNQTTPNSYNKITNNRTYATLGQLWDGGGVYTTGYQGTSAEDALLIEGNVFSDKNPDRGGNTVYTDGMSRFVTVRNNVMYNNPQAKVYMGDPVAANDPFALQYALIPILNSVPYGTDHGGCRTYGDIDYDGNYWQYPFFFDVCPFIDGKGEFYPTGLNYTDNKGIAVHVSEAQAVADGAGATKIAPESIPSARWILPSETITLKPLPGQSDYNNTGL